MEPALSRASATRGERVFRWAAVPLAAFAGWWVGIFLPALPGALFRGVYSGEALERLIGIEYRTAVLGAAAAVGTVVGGSVMAPAYRRAVALVLFALGAWAAWLVLHPWMFPETHPRGYETTDIPLIGTLLGGVGAVALVWLVRLPCALPPRTEQPPLSTRIGELGRRHTRGVKGWPLAVSLLLLLGGSRAAAQAAAYPAPVEGDFIIRDFAFGSGERLPELRIHYRTLGTPVRDARGVVRNAVLVLHGTTGSGANFLTPTFAGRLFGAGQLLDARRYFIILPDGIGHGGSSRPSEGLRARFPRYTYDDMVRAQHRLVTEHLRVNHLRLVMGTSMGGMHTWVWGYTHPGFMDALMPLASAPVQIAGRNRMMRRMIADAIRGDPEWRGGDYTAQPRGLADAVHILMMMTSSPLQQQKAAPTRDAADSLLERTVRRYVATMDANDMLYAFDASRDYDPSPHLGEIRAPLLAVNSADDLVNPPELGILEREIRGVPRGRYVLIPTSDATRGHGTHSLPDVWGRYLAELLAQTESR